MIDFCGILAYSAIGTVATIWLLFFTGFCEHDREAFSHVTICPESTDFCLEYVSTYIMSCKYGNTTQKFVVYVMYYAFLVILLLLYFIATNNRKFNHALLFFPVSLLSGIGITLVYMYDSHDIKFKNNKVEYTGYDEHPQWKHLLGVLLLFTMSGIIFIDILFYETVQIGLQEKSPAKNRMRIIRNIDTGLDFFYFVSCTGFGVTFFLRVLFVSVIFEYMTGIFFILVFLLSYHFIKQKKDAIIYNEQEQCI